MSARRAWLGWLAWFICFVLPGCTGPSVEAQPEVWVPEHSTPRIRTVEALEDTGLVAIHAYHGAYMSLSCHADARRIDERHWAQDGGWLWLLCGRQVMLIDVLKWEHVVTYDAKIHGVMEEIRVGGGMAAVSIEAPPGHPKFALVDWHGRTYWTVAGDDAAPHAFDIDDGGHVFAFARTDGVTVQPLDGGPPYHLDVQAAELALVGRKLITGTYGRYGGTHFEWFDTATGERLGTLDLDCCNHSSR